MTALISARALSKGFTSEKIFDGISLTIDEGERLGIIGPNGAGKSTLLAILAGTEEADAGEVVRRRQLPITFVRQSETFRESASIYDLLREAGIEARVPPEDLERRISIVTGKCGFDDTSVAAGTLSGGWRKRLSIARALVPEPELMLLDEPTNHLDIEGVLWLESLLGNSRFSWAMVSHDRYFLSRIATRILEVNSRYPDGVLTFDGNYERFLEKKEEYLEAQRAHAGSLASKVRRETEWLRRGAKARTRKAQARIDSAMKLQEELSDLKKRARETSFEFDFSTTGRMTRKLIEAKHLHVSIGGRKICSDLNLLLSPGSALGILGRNGTGKTTLLRTLVGDLAPISGTVKHAADLRIVRFDQFRTQLRPEWTLQRSLTDGRDGVVFQGESMHVISWARRFRFRPDQLDVRISDLSGGEQARVLLANLMLTQADVLMLDEPANDLDIDFLEVLEDRLIEFPGAVVLISHDRYMLERVCTSFVGLDGKGRAATFASYEQWETQFKNELAEDSRREAASGAPAARTAESKRPARKLSYKDQRDYDSIEQRIMDAEELLEGCKARVAEPAVACNAELLLAACADLEKAQREVDRLYDRWRALEEMIKGLG